MHGDWCRNGRLLSSGGGAHAAGMFLEAKEAAAGFGDGVGREG